MASNGFAKVLQRNSWRLTTILVYAVLEWILIFLLLINALFQYIITKFATFFGLHPPCLWCSRVDHILEPKEPDFYKKLICERHAREISLLGYCSTHRKLVDAHGMCEECAFSRPDVSSSAEGNGSQSNWLTCMSMVADLSKRGDAKRLLMNGHVDDFSTEEAKSEDKASNGWVSKDLCSCCTAPLNDKLYSQNFFKTIFFNGRPEGIVKSQWNAFDYSGNVVERVLEEEDESKSQSGCVCGGNQVKISEVFVDSPDESDVGSSSSVADGEMYSMAKVERTDEDVKDLKEAVDGVQHLPRRLEVVQNDDARVDFESDIYVDKKIAYPEIVTHEWAMAPDVTVTEIQREDTPYDQGFQRLDSIEGPQEIGGLNCELALEGLGTADVEDDVLESPLIVETVSEGMAKHFDGSDDLDSKNIFSGGSEEVLPKSLEVSPEAEGITVMTKHSDGIDDLGSKNICSGSYENVLPKSLKVSPKAESIPVEEKGADSIPARQTSIEMNLVEDTACVTENEQGTMAAGNSKVDSIEYPSDLRVAVPEPLPSDLDDLGASVIRERGTEEEEVLGDLEVDGEKTLEADHAEISATFKDVATSEVIMQNSEVTDAISGRKEVDAPECQGPEDIEDDLGASVIREGGIEETEVFGDLEDGKKTLEADPLEISATFTDVATPDVIMENSEVADVISERREVDAPDCQGPEDIEDDLGTPVIREEGTRGAEILGDLEVNGQKTLEADHAEISTTFTDEATPEVIMANSEVTDAISGKEVDAPECQSIEDQTQCARVEEGFDEKSSQNLVQTDIETDHHVDDGADNVDEDRVSEEPSSIEGIHLLNKRVIMDRKDSGAESWDGSVFSEIDGEFAVDRLKRALETERKSLNTLYLELEEERSASAIAANQSMAMITRLQEEKAAVQMEALQYQRMMEEQSEYDQEALQLLNEILVKREKEKQELEKELEMCRKRVIRYEAKERREKRRKVKEGESQSSAEKGEENNEQNQTPDNQSRRIRTSSSSSLSYNSDELLSDGNDVDEGLDIQQSNQNTPTETIMSAGRGYENKEQKTSLDESLADFEEERISILEQLKILEEKLHKLAEDDQAGVANPEANGVNEHVFNGLLTEDYGMQGKNEGNDEDDMKEAHVDEETMETMHGNGTLTPRRVAGAKAKRLLPLFDATSVDGDSLHHTEEFSPADASNDWRTVSMVVRDNNRLAIEEEVYHVYERLQALEADREFLKHTIKSLRKGDEGMKLLQEIAQHLRDLRRVELKARNFSDVM